MKRKVFVIEDDFTGVERVLSNIRDILGIAMKRSQISPEDMGETTIYVLHVIGGNKEDKGDEFSVVRTCLNNERDFRLTYEYIPTVIDKDSYPRNIEECEEIICGKIDNFSDHDVYSIMLDVVLVKDKDYDAMNQGLILSQRLYERYRGACIPYTNYADSEILFRHKWGNGVNFKSQPFERADLNTSGINLELKKCVFMQLQIGESPDERI